MKITAFLLVFASMCASASVTAYFTGNSRFGTSYGGRMVNQCEYEYMGQTFWQNFSGFCPSSIEVD